MGLFIAIILTIFFIAFSYMINGEDMLAPSFVILTIFLMSMLFNLVNYSNWNIQIGTSYILVIFFGFFVTVIAEIAGNIVGKKITIKKPLANSYSIGISKKTVIIISVCMSVFSIIYFKEIMKIALVYGNMSLQSPLQAIRNAIYSVGSVADLDNGISTWILHGTLVCKILAYIFIYIFAYKFFFENTIHKIKNNLIYLIPCVIYLVQSVLSTSRSQILYFLVGTVYISYLMYYCKHGKINRKAKKKFIKYGLITIVSFCIAFYILGFLTRKSDSLSFFNNISIYIGGSQVSLNNWLEKYKGIRTNYFGEESLVGLRKILFKLGFTDSYKVRHLEFITFGMDRGNVYTVFRRYISDFGYGGMCLMQFISTFILSSIYFFIKKRRQPNGMIIIFGYIAYSFAMEAIDELFFSSIIEISNFYILVYGYILYYFLIKRNLVCEKNQ